MRLVLEKILQQYINIVFVPDCKNKNGDISDADDYGPVPLVTMTSELFEHYVFFAFHLLLPLI